MVRSVVCLVVLSMLMLSIAAAGETPKPQVPQPPVVKPQAAQPVKPQAPQPVKAAKQVKAAKAAESPQAKRVAEIKAKLAGVKDKLGPAQKEAMKARELFATAEGKVNVLKQDIAQMEKAIVETIARGQVEEREATAAAAARTKAQDEAKRWAEMARKISNLEQQVQTLKSKLEAATKKAPAPPAQKEHKAVKKDLKPAK